MKSIFSFVVAAALTTIFGANAFGALNIFTIGNSLTWDTQPALYGAEYHIASSRSLTYIHDNPNLRDANTTSWVTAFQAKSYDYVTVQPYGATSRAQDVAAISEWLALQPNAVFVLHQGWTFASNFNNAYNNAQIVNTLQSPAYFNALIGDLKVLFPSRDIRINPSTEVLALIRNDIVNGVGPYTALSNLYRDTLHMSYADGRFLQHNLMRQTLGLEFSNVGFSGVSAENQTYLLSKVLELKPAEVVGVPEPTSMVLMGSAMTAFGIRRMRRKLPKS